MNRPFLFLVLTAAVSSHVFGGIAKDVSPQRGRSVAQITWTDDAGQLRQLSQFAGYPVILLPIYTRCQTACIRNVDQLKNAVSDSAADPRQFRVLLFSFDSTDTPSTLATYRKRENIPLNWSIAAASQENIDALLESIGFQYGRAGKEFAHPNLLVVLDSKLRVAKWIYGTGYSAPDIDVALKVASGGSDWIGQHVEWLYALLLFSGSLLCVALVYHVLQLMPARRINRSGVFSVKMHSH